MVNELDDKIEMDIAGRTFSLETGWIARQAHGAVLVRYGETVVLVSAVAENEPRAGAHFLPLTVDYLEKTFAAGKIPGGFFKREGRPTEKEVLTCRLIDRPIRPLFPEVYNLETQVIATVLSVDQENDPDVLAITGASAALMISDIPFGGPLAAVRVGKVNGNLVLNPTISQLKESKLDVVVVGKKEAIVMVEGSATALSEDELLEAIVFGHKGLQGLLEVQEKVVALWGKPKRALATVAQDPELETKLTELCAEPLAQAAFIGDKKERREKLKEIKEQALLALSAQYPEKESEIKEAWEGLERRVVRQRMLAEKIRIDGRGFSDIRPINCRVGALPRTHGSAFFTRGETQVLATTTLGTSQDEQRIDSLEGESSKRFMLHYNFPPFCVGEVKYLRSPGRREIGHGVLAERAIAPVLPPNEEFPYTIRIVSDVLESNGSSSMATVCGGILSLMDAGVPIKAPVAGVALGLILEGQEVAILSDILGDEDHLGDMDFKIAGTAQGVTALQMDIKIGGITAEVLRAALQQARVGRLYVLEEMAKAIGQPREDISIYAPRIITIQVRPEKIKDVIGPGGKNIRAVIEKTGVKIDVEDSGKVNIASADGAAAQEAIRLIRELTHEPEVGKIYRGKVRKIMEFGAFVEILPGTDGLVHISQLSDGFVKKVSDVLKEGDEVMVKVLEVDAQGKIRLSRKDAVREMTQISNAETS